jgi:anti-sigma28 factor (negative regulator of flagellin synthesis)
MNDILPLNASAGTATGLGSRAPEASVAGQLLAPEDRVDISDIAQSLSALDPATGIRTEKVAAIREAILNGTYETEDKLDAAAARLLKVLRSNAAKTSD